MNKVPVILFFSVCVFFVSEACKCAVRHPQRIFCQSDYVIQGRILREQSVDSWRKRYEVKVQENFKNRYADPVRGSKVWIYTASSSPACGVMFDIGNKYVIAGSRDMKGKLEASSCSWNVKVSDLSNFQRQALRNMSYKRNCACKIRGCPHARCEKSDGCLVPYTNSNCYHRNALCKQSGNTCSWTPNIC
ncbi:metalloproteinase inhibitor 2-like [Ostrea edulis]|uniref:metalloproteinase inhibitor 2-like n=1 Tax=Ostrea edulis TaxID=37623 RepID=UPI0024AEAB2F|nr:metalloproteinase inhibitor 2-like [Ostrea edulis]